MNRLSANKRNVFLLSWVLSYLAAVILGITITSFILKRAHPGIPVNPMNRVLFVLVSGFLLGIAHWFNLRKIASRTGLLILLHPIAWSIAWITGGLFNLFFYPAEPGNIKVTLFLFTFIGLIYGFFLGAAEMVILRKTYARSWQLIIVNCVGWAVGLLLGGVVLGFRYEWIDFWVVQSFVEFNPFLYGIASLIAGLSTGLFMLYLLNHGHWDSQTRTATSIN